MPYRLLARAAIEAIDRDPSLASPDRTYTLLDLSSGLQACQRQTLKGLSGVAFQLGDALVADPPGPAPDLVISNEVLADLGVLRVEDGPGPGRELLERYDLPGSPLPGPFLINSGAIAMVERLATLLAPGGLAVLTEYGSEDWPPWRVPLEGHDEYSIRFDHLVTVARALALDPHLENLGTFMGFDGSHPVLIHESKVSLEQDLGPRLGLPPLPRRPLDPPTVEAHLGRHAFRMSDLVFRPMSEGRNPLNPFQFWALTLRAPAGGHAPGTER